MEALRNYVQHRGLPLHSITLGGRWIDTLEGERRSEKTTLYLNLQTLRKDAKFKRSVLAELASQEEKIPLNPLVREYVTGIVQVQQNIRQELAPRVSEWDRLLQTLISRYQEEAEDKILGLAAVARAHDQTHREEVQIFRDFIDRRRWLEKKNSGAGELSKLIVTSE